MILSISDLSETSSEAFFSVWKEWHVPKDYVLLREHAVSDYFYFFNKGWGRIFYRKNGREITEWITPEKSMCFSIDSFFRRSPSKLIIHSLEPAHVYGLPHKELEYLASKYHDVETLYRKMLAASLILSQRRMESIQFETAEHRYRSLVKEHPDFLQKVPLSYVASFLGVTLETLSRIRSSITA